MFAVLFEVHPKPERWDAYLGMAGALRPELERIDGFIDNIRYRSLTRAGWLLSLSSWRDEKALVRWRTRERHHLAQARGRSEIFADYRLRVGELTRDSRVRHAPPEQRLDETEAGEARAVVLIDAGRPAERVEQTAPEDVAGWLGLSTDARSLVAWDAFEAVLTPGNVILLLSWGDLAAALVFESMVALQPGCTPPAGPRGARLRHVRPPRGAAVLPRREAVMGVATERYLIFETAAGFCAIAWNRAGITCLRLPDRTADAAKRALLRRLPGAGPSAPPPQVAGAVAAAQRYFDGEAVDFSGFDLDLGDQEPFFRQVYAAARRVGWGQTTTYGRLTKELGAGPEAARDVGQAMARNPVPLIIPCHRVLAAGGRIGGFSAPGGAAAKLRMLALEGVQVEPPRPAPQPDDAPLLRCRDR